jgi:hypothetical protein
MTSLRRLLLSRGWIWVLSFGLFAYLFHKIGSVSGFYPRFFWFQMLTHYFSASAMALLLARVGLDAELRDRTLVVFVVGFSLVGAGGWELLEYYRVVPSLHWHGIEDSALDLVMDGAGVGTVLFLLRTRFRPIIEPQSVIEARSEEPSEVG